MLQKLRVESWGAFDVQVFSGRWHELQICTSDPNAYLPSVVKCSYECREASAERM
jgi:hypothetical protein